MQKILLIMILLSAFSLTTVSADIIPDSVSREERFIRQQEKPINPLINNPGSVIKKVPQVGPAQDLLFGSLLLVAVIYSIYRFRLNKGFRSDVNDFKG